MAMTAVTATQAGAAVRGSYNFNTNDGEFTGTMTIARHHTWSQEYDGFTDTGTWTKHRKDITLTVTADNGSGDTGCVFNGVIDRTGISDRGTQGNWSCPTGTGGEWFATHSPVHSSSSHGSLSGR
jgi:hypothetical protein